MLCEIVSDYSRTSSNVLLSQSIWDILLSNRCMQDVKIISVKFVKDLQSQLKEVKNT